jgi:hypothetical protein
MLLKIGKTPPGIQNDFSVMNTPGSLDFPVVNTERSLDSLVVNSPVMNTTGNRLLGVFETGLQKNLVLTNTVDQGSKD